MALRIPSRSHAPIQYSTLQPTRRYSTSFSNHEKDRHVHLRGKIYVPPKDSVYIPSKHLVFKFQAPRFRVKVHPHIEPKPLLFRSGPFKRYYQNSRSQLTPIVPLLKHSSDELQGGQRVFINTLASAAALLDSLGLDRSSWMTIASGAVFLHQLRQSGMGKSVAVNRVPTDLDIIVASSTNESILKKLYANVAFPDIACLRTEPLNHFGFQLTGPALSIAFANRLKVDITTHPWLATYLMGWYRYHTQHSSPSTS